MTPSFTRERVFENTWHTAGAHVRSFLSDGSESDFFQRMTNPLGGRCKTWASVMGDTFLASQKGGESMYINALEKHQQCLPICLFFPDDKESGKSWNVVFPAWERKAGPSTRKEEIPVLPTT